RLSARGQRVGVVHGGGVRPHDPVAFQVLRAHRLELFVRVGDRVLVVQVVDPAGAGVLDVKVHLPGLHRRPGAVGALDVGEVADLRAGRGQGELGDVAEDDVLGEVLRADCELDALELGDRRDAAGAHGQGE